MDLLQIAGIALLVGLLILLLREHQPQFAMILTVAAGAILFYALFTKIEWFLQMLRQLAVRANIHELYITTLLKIIGVAYISEFIGQALRDAGLEAMAAKMELAGKVFILLLAFPVLQMILDTILKLMEK